MWELYYRESWVLKKWCFWTLVLEKMLESLLDCKEIQPVHPKGNQSWIFIGRTDAEAGTPILWPHDAKNWLIGKDPDAGKDWRQEKGMTEDEMVVWHYLLVGHEFEQALGFGEGQRSMACCSPWGHKELDLTEWLNWTDSVLNFKLPNLRPFTMPPHNGGSTALGMCLRTYFQLHLLLPLRTTLLFCLPWLVNPRSMDLIILYLFLVKQI